MIEMYNIYPCMTLVDVLRFYDPDQVFFSGSGFGWLKSPGSVTLILKYIYFRGSGGGGGPCTCRVPLDPSCPGLPGKDK